MQKIPIVENKNNLVNFVIKKICYLYLLFDKNYNIKVQDDFVSKLLLEKNEYLNSTIISSLIHIYKLFYELSYIFENIQLIKNKKLKIDKIKYGEAIQIINNLGEKINPKEAGKDPY